LSFGGSNRRFRALDLGFVGEVGLDRIIPSIEYQRIDGLKVLPGLSIASKRRVRSVLLLARVPVEEVRTVALDTSSRTSAALVRCCCGNSTNSM